MKVFEVDYGWYVNGKSYKRSISVTAESEKDLNKILIDQGIYLYSITSITEVVK